MTHVYVKTSVLEDGENKLKFFGRGLPSGSRDPCYSGKESKDLKT